MRKIFDIFTTPTAQKIAERELATAKRELLLAESTKEYATRIVEYQKDRVRRLSASIASGELQ